MKRVIDKLKKDERDGLSVLATITLEFNDMLYLYIPDRLGLLFALGSLPLAACFDWIFITLAVPFIRK